MFAKKKLKKTFLCFLKKLCIFGCAGSLLLRAGFLQLQRVGFSLWRLLSLQSVGSRVRALQQ